MSDKASKDTPIIRVKVTVTVAVNPQTGKMEYVPKYNPEVIPVTESDTILSFCLHKTADDIIIQSVTPRPSSNTQLSTPSVSKNGKLAIISDINTVAETLHLDFVYGSNSSSERIGVCVPEDGDQYPEIVNEPPP